MDIWTELTEFLLCGLMVLPLTLGFGMGSFEVFAVTLGLMQVALIAVLSGAPNRPDETDKRDEKSRKNRSRPEHWTNNGKK